MPRIRLAVKQGSVVVLSVLLIGAFPASALADSGSPSDGSGSTSTTTNQPGPNTPSGPDANTYTYDPTTGLWENQYYTWNPTTNQTTPITPPTYSYNPTTGHWDTTDWIYNPATGTYVPNVVEVTTPPAGALVSDPSSTSATDPSISNTGPDSTNSNNNTSNNTGIFNGFYNATISNNLTSNAQSGDATVSGNTTGGDAVTGSADDIANVLNLLQSTGGILQGGNLSTFTYNVNGNVTGDLMLDPSNISTTGPDSNNANNTTQNTDLTVNDQGTGTINNNINLNADSGNAAVTGNTTGGSATSGDANAAADLINVIGSAIGANSGFLGVININGNLNGDILLPPNVIDSLIASSGPNSNNSNNTTQNTNLSSDQTTNQAINNNVDTNAATGQASVSGNTSGGSATTGNATNNVTLLNLTGQQIIGKDALLVFVNYNGNWVGLIMNAPAGSSAAALGGDVTDSISNSGPNSNNSNNNTSNTNANVNETNNQAINNDVNVNATSGNATVSDNTNGGNATSGNASADANILNIEGSNIDLSDWLGILFINVFGTWNGSFGVNTSAGDPTVGGLTSGLSSSTVKTFAMTPGTGGSTQFTAVNNSVLSAFGGGSASNSNQTSTVLGSTTTKTPKTPTLAPQVSAKSGTFPVVLLSVGLLGFSSIIASTPEARKKLRSFGKPVLRGLQTASARLFMFLF